MPERTVAVSQIEDEVEYRVRTVVSRVRMAEKHGEPYPSEWVNNQIGAGRERVRFLLSQPTPTTEPECTCGSGRSAHSRDNLLCERNHAPAAPPSIADMVPGTTFRVMEAGVLEVFAMRVASPLGEVVLPDGTIWPSSHFDPATIRDVRTP